MLNMLNLFGGRFWKMCFFLLKCWICWICWMVSGTSQSPSLKKKTLLFNISPVGAFFWGYVELFLQKEPLFEQKMLLSAEMLNMLNMLVSALQKKRFFLLKCWICWICWIVLGTSQSPSLSPKKALLFNISPVGALFWGHVELFLQKERFFLSMLNFFCWKSVFFSYVEFFLQKEPHFEQKMLLSAEMLNMLNMLVSALQKMCFFLLKCWICWICWMHFRHYSLCVCSCGQ